VKVVSDTSPISYLILIGQTALVEKLFGRVLIPPAVMAELLHGGTPASVRQEVSQRPPWLEVVHVSPVAEDASLAGLHLGEREAIQLADLISADLVVVDERKARRAALARGHKVAGLVGLLLWGAQCGFVDLEDALARLQATSFRLHPHLLELIRQRFC
jgi:predicted nucleic acid-binding protein